MKMPCTNLSPMNTTSLLTKCIAMPMRHCVYRQTSIMFLRPNRSESDPKMTPPIITPQK